MEATENCIYFHEEQATSVSTLSCVRFLNNFLSGNAYYREIFEKLNL